MKKHDPDSAAKWLWVIHDMVNQNLGKICIDYSTLKKKHQSYSCIVHDLNILDVILFIWYSCKSKTKICQGINILLKLLKMCGKFKVTDIVFYETMSNEEILIYRNRIHIHYGLNNVENTETMLMQYNNAAL